MRIWMGSLHKISFVKGISFIKHIRRKRKRIKQVLKSYPYLENGHYLIVFGNLITVVNKRYVEYIEIARRALFKEYILSLVNPYIRVENHQSQKKYQAFFLTMTDDIKFVDYKNSLILTIYSNPKKREQMLNRFLYFENNLKTTFIKNENEGILERYIQAERRKAWDAYKIKKTYEKILCDMTGYLDKVRKGENYKKYRFLLENYNDILEYFVQEFPDVCFMEVIDRIGAVPVCTIHGDLHMDNVVIDDDEVYYIDFEDAREDIFYYDLFNVIFVEYINYNSTILLDAYIDGDASVMSLAGTMFRSIGCDFMESSKLDYVFLYVLHRFRHDIDNLGGVSKNKNYKINETIDFLLGRYKSFVGYITKRML